MSLSHATQIRNTVFKIIMVAEQKNESQSTKKNETVRPALLGLAVDDAAFVTPSVAWGWVAGGAGPARR